MPQADAYLEARLHRHRTVEDVMTTSVVTVDRLTPYKEIACLLAEHRISSLPVLADNWQVIGVISETELLAARDNAARRGRAASRSGRLRGSRPAILTAGELMTAPPVTVRPDAAISAATRVMTTHHVTSLPVTGPDDELIGIVSRRDLLSVFLRPDAEIVVEVRHLLDEMPFGNPVDVTVTVRHGVVILVGFIRLEPAQRHDLIRAAIRLIWDVDGVVDVVNKTTDPAGDEPRVSLRQNVVNPGFISLGPQPWDPAFTGRYPASRRHHIRGHRIAALALRPRKRGARRLPPCVRCGGHCLEGRLLA